MKPDHKDENDLAQTVPSGPAGRLAALFVQSKLTPLFVIAALLLGVMATFSLPREEEPQIKVPMIDLHVAMPGAAATEVAERVVRPLERIVWEVPGVEYVYSTASPGSALTVVRFAVGEDPTLALQRLSSRLESQFNRIPQGVSFPLIKPRSIDDVPILALTFHPADEQQNTPGLDQIGLRQIAMETATRLAALPEVAEMQIIGGLRRQVRIQLDPSRLAARNLDALAVAASLGAANQKYQSGSVVQGNAAILIDAGGFFRDAADVENAVIGVHDGIPVTVQEIATVLNGAEEVEQLVYHSKAHGQPVPALTVTFAKRPGTNAIAVVDRLLERLDNLRGTIIPESVAVTISRDYAESAAHKSNELLWHMAIAVISVALLMALMLGMREALIVIIAIPATLALTLAIFQLGGYTLNRITLFALIFSIGILVDDAIVVIENIVRHRALPDSQGKSLARIAVEATGEVGNPTILATWAVIAAILPMASVGGLMGPYMRPIPVGASAAMLWSLLIAFIVTPWAAVLILRGREKHGGHEPKKDDWFTRFYRAFMGHMLHKVGWRWGFLSSIVVLLLLAMALVPMRWVQVKMLPFDNKSEFMVHVDLDEGATLESSARISQRLAKALDELPELQHLQVYIGTAAPFTFNGLVRHSYLRQSPHGADIQVNLVAKGERSRQSHAIAMAARKILKPIADEEGARLTIAEVPPGPPVLQTLVCEVYGPNVESRKALAKAIETIFHDTPGVVDIDVFRAAPQQRWRFEVDQVKSALHGIPVATIAEHVRLAVAGKQVGLLHRAHEREDIAVIVELPRGERPYVGELRLRAADGNLVPLSELTTVRQEQREDDLYSKNLEPVIYVVGDVAGAIEAPVYAIQAMQGRIDALNAGDFGGEDGAQITTWHARQPASTLAPALKWDGEWHITIEVFRDLGTAFAVVVVLIYLLMVGWFKSFLIPLVVMAAIPFSLVGILPGHALMGAFFSATSMIGFMAGAGIVVRNSIILVDFIHLRLAAGDPLDKAVIEAGAVRFRPMLLTAMALVVGSAVMLLDPIFQGLAISLMAGEIASLFISRMAIPILYYMLRKNHISTPSSALPPPHLHAQTSSSAP